VKVTIDDRLLEEARKIGGHRSNTATVKAALHEYIQHRKQVKILDFFGAIEFNPKHDYKRQRRKS
jgi:hypothetical protein